MSDLYGVVGHPIGHSLSPLIHTMLFEYYNLDCKYEKYDIAPELKFVRIQNPMLFSASICLSQV